MELETHGYLSNQKNILDYNKVMLDMFLGKGELGAIFAVPTLDTRLQQMSLLIRANFYEKTSKQR